jgi:predicted MPP superfamily phosphohydrolase
MNRIMTPSGAGAVPLRERVEARTSPGCLGGCGVAADDAFADPCFPELARSPADRRTWWGGAEVRSLRLYLCGAFAVVALAPVLASALGGWAVVGGGGRGWMVAGGVAFPALLAGGLWFVGRGARLVSAQLLAPQPGWPAAHRAQSVLRVTVILACLALASALVSRAGRGGGVEAAAWGYLCASVLLVGGRFAYAGARRRGAGRVRMEALEVPRESGREGIRVAHWSDLHLTAGPAMPRMNGRPSPNARFAALVRAHAEVLATVDALLVTGDVTNGGGGEEWAQFFARVEPSLLARAVLVPGNHDLYVPHPRDADVMERAHARARIRRRVRALAAMDRVQGARSWVFSEGMPPVRLRAFLAAHAGMLRAAAGLPGSAEMDARAAEAETRAVWEAVFPLAVEVSPRGPLFYVLDSNAPGRSVLDNGFGRVDPDSLARFRRALAHFGDRPAAVLLHHHPAIPPRGLRDVIRQPRAELVGLFLGLENAGELLDALPSRSCVVFHGHRHAECVSRLAPHLQIVSAPSTTLGDNGSPHPGERIGFHDFRLVPSADGGVSIADRRWHPLRSSCIR